ncbi:carbon storage regulator CsrA [Paenibacillus pasadenensis]|uniref:carbon storage regulator CsrA n=1 Tax=Paenibacillus pasadenensis TaxID=217090 RepID=UPI00203CEBAD|nr:carbon storage regulator CsrA [Paenibacillus pasadenensis]MCM3750195.1 carbon storage regulator CsrA [Paenibacillus pasadenensis]
MLVLGRRKGESILIGPDIELTVLEIGADGIKLGISAPRDVTILRKELYQEIADTNRDAVQHLVSVEDLKIQFKSLTLPRSL